MPIAGRMAFKGNLDFVTAGARARRERERRRAKRRARSLERHPHLVGLLPKLGDDPEHETAWAAGASGEEIVAEALDERCPNAIVLHGRSLPGGRGAIDHLAIAPSGVYVIDTERHTGKIEVRKPFFGEPRLIIGGRDRTRLVEGLSRQVRAVRAAMEQIAPAAPVHGCFCFVNPTGILSATDLPLLRTLSINGYPLLVPRKLAKRLSQSGELGSGEALSIAEALAGRFPRA